jgi:hypothetical protein
MFCEGAELGTAKEVLKKTLPKGQMPYPENGQAAAIGNRVLDEIGSIKLGLRDPDMAEVESLASALLMMSSSFGGTSGFSRTTDVGVPSRMALKITPELSPRNGSVPVVISYKTAPKENKSVRPSSSLARTCSGDM